MSDLFKGVELGLALYALARLIYALALILYDIVKHGWHDDR